MNEFAPTTDSVNEHSLSHPLRVPGGLVAEYANPSDAQAMATMLGPDHIVTPGVTELYGVRKLVPVTTNVVSITGKSGAWSDVYTADELVRVLGVQAIRIAKMGAYGIATDMEHAAECIDDLWGRCEEARDVVARLLGTIEDLTAENKALLSPRSDQ